MWIHDVWAVDFYLPFLQLANNLRDSDLIQELRAHLARIQSLTQQVADNFDDVHNDVKHLSKSWPRPGGLSNSLSLKHGFYASHPSTAHQSHFLFKSKLMFVQNFKLQCSRCRARTCHKHLPHTISESPPVSQCRYVPANLFSLVAHGRRSWVVAQLWNPRLSSKWITILPSLDGSSLFRLFFTYQFSTRPTNFAK